MPDDRFFLFQKLRELVDSEEDLVSWSPRRLAPVLERAISDPHSPLVSAFCRPLETRHTTSVAPGIHGNETFGASDFRRPTQVVIRRK